MFSTFIDLQKSLKIIVNILFLQNFQSSFNNANLAKIKHYFQNQLFKQKRTKKSGKHKSGFSSLTKDQISRFKKIQLWRKLSLTFQQPLNKVVNVYFTFCHVCSLSKLQSQITLFCFTSLFFLFLVKIHNRIFFLGCFFSLPKFYLGRTYTHTRRKRQILLFSQLSPPARFEQPPPSQSSKEITVLPDEVSQQQPKVQKRANSCAKAPNDSN